MEIKIISHPGVKLTRKDDYILVSVDKDSLFEHRKVTSMWLPMLFQFDMEKYDLRVVLEKSLRNKLILSKFNIKGCPRIEISNLSEDDIKVKKFKNIFELRFYERIETHEIPIDYQKNMKGYWIDEE